MKWPRDSTTRRTDRRSHPAKNFTDATSTEETILSSMFAEQVTTGEATFFHRASKEAIFPARRHSRWTPSRVANSCCSHPRVGESLADAVIRRSEQELGLTVDAKFIYKFEYSAQFGDSGSERELCSVYVAQTNDEPVFNTEEISACRWVAPAKLAKALVDNADHYTPWLKLEWETLRSEHGNALRAS